MLKLKQVGGIDQTSGGMQWSSPKKISVGTMKTIHKKPVMSESHDRGGGGAIFCLEVNSRPGGGGKQICCGNSVPSAKISMGT